MKKREAAAQLAALALALGVGVLLGARACAPEPEVIERTAEPETKLVYHCPEPDSGPDAADTGAEAAAAPQRPEAPKKARALPDAGRPNPADQRRRLLGWARDQSDGLIGCRKPGAAAESVVVTLELDDTRALRGVKVNAPSSDDIPASALTCIRQRIRRWQPPEALVGNRREIVFRLDL